MEIVRIWSLEMLNFKKFQHFKIDLSGKVVNIRGRNESGKTTIADAIMWCLFGKNIQGKSDFELKTHDERGRDIDHLEHWVEIVLSKDGAKHHIRRTLKEKWTKKRGVNDLVLTGNTTEYMVDGELNTAADFKKFVESIVSEDIFRIITSTTYFAGLKWQQQRKFLEQIAGNVTKEEITGGDPSKDPFEAGQTDIIAVKKHLSYQIKKVKEELEKIPIRLAELQKTKPEPEDWVVIEEDIRKEKAAIKEYEDKLMLLYTGNSSLAKTKAVREKMELVRKEMDEAEKAIRRTVDENNRKQIQDMTAARREFANITKCVSDIEDKIRNYAEIEKRYKLAVEETELKAQSVRDRWAENSKLQFELEEDDMLCPTCGQLMPQSIVSERRDMAYKSFNKKKADTKIALTKEAEEIKAYRAKLDEEMEGFRAQFEADTKSLEEYKARLNEQHKEVVRLEKPTFTYDELIASNEEYQSKKQEYEKLEHSILDITDEKDEASKKLIELQVVEIKGRLSHDTIRLAAREQYNRILRLEAECEAEKNGLMSQLSKLERQENIANEYQERMGELLEENVNKHFALVSWKMFRTVNNSGEPYLEPYCECYVKGSSYHAGLNSAGQVNAGLDIINTMCRLYGVVAPIVLDNAESVNEFVQTEGQQIRLYVDESSLTTEIQEPLL